MSDTSNKGFTLLELLLAASISAVIFVAVYSSFYAAVLNYKRVNSRSSTFQAGRAVLNKISSDIKNSFVYLKSDSGFKGENKSLEFFTKIISFDQQQEEYLEVAKVKYSILNQELVRQQAKGINTIKPESGKEIKAIVQEIKDLKFEYASALPADALNLYEWADSWPKDDTQVGKLPLAVKVCLFVGTEKQEFQRIIPLPLEVISDQQ